MRRGGEPSLTLRTRLSAARECWARTSGVEVLVSGGRLWWGSAEASVMRRELLASGIPDASLITELCSLNTRENARYCRRIAVARAFRRVALVTSDFHMNRAVRHFRAVGFDCVEWPAASPGERVTRIGALMRRLSSHCQRTTP